MEIRPLSARSVVLSLLLGAHPPELAARDLVTVGRHFGIGEATLRVALTRMVANGDLERSEAVYRLSHRMLARQRRQDLALDETTTAWSGDWETVVVTPGGRNATERAALRTSLADLRLAELREGVWLRPANLARPLPFGPGELLTTFRAVPDEAPAILAERLFSLARYNDIAHRLLEALHTAKTGADRMATAATLVRHLRADPALPEALLPDDWSGPALRRAYSDYQAEVIASGIAIRVSASR